jgi:DNA-binding MarR family transcriptional regulator
MQTIAPEMRYSAMIAPAVLAFADDPARGRSLALLIAEAGGRLVAEGPIADAGRRIDRQVGPGALVVIDVVNDDGDLLDDLLSRIDAGVRLGRFAAIVVTSHDMLDIVVARLPDPGTIILVNPDTDQLAEAVTRALTPVEAVLWDSSGESNSRRLAQLSEEAGRIARSLAKLAGGEPARPLSEIEAEQGTIDAQLSDLAVVRAILRLRRLRDQYLEPALFADPAWDMLLDLTAAQLERRRVAVSSLCIAAAVPPTTALRWITTMTDQGLFARKPDPDDGRRIFIALSDAAATAMRSYVQAARRTLLPAG